MDRVFEDLDAASSLDNDVKPVWIVSFQLGILRRGILARQLDVLVTGPEVLGKVHLQTTRGSHHNAAAAILTQKLREHETGRASAEDQHGRAHLRGNLVQTVRGTGSGLQERGVHVRKILDLEHLASRVSAVLGESTVHSHAVGLEVLAEQFITATAVEASAAELGVVGDHTLADLKVLDFGTDGSNDAYRLVAGDQGELNSQRRMQGKVVLILPEQ